MWMLVLMTLVNAALHQQAVQNKYRIELGIVQLGIAEFAMGLTFLYAIIRGGTLRAQTPPLRTHPVLVWILLPFAVGGLCGIMGGLFNGNEMKWVLSSAREWFAFPVCILCGYRLLAGPANVWRMIQVTLFAGVVTATALFYSFGGKTEVTQLTGSINQMRGIINHWHSEYAAVAGLVMVYVVMTRFPLWKQWVSTGVGLYAYIGYAATLSRLGFLILFFGTASTYALLPQGERLQKFLRSIFLLPVLFFACWGALWVGDQIIGRDFAGKVLKHIQSLLPGERAGADPKAWDSRMDGIYAELGIWIKNPLMGQGFGAGETAYLSGRTTAVASIKHNSWTATLAEMGLFGFTGLAVMVGSMILMGYRMVHGRTDRVSVLMGALGFIGGVVFFLRCSGTMGLTSRAAMGFGVICGMLIRTREMQETAMAFAGASAYDQPHVDAHSGLLVPEYDYEPSPFGATSN